MTIPMLRMRMHRDPGGRCWADTDNIPHWTVAGRDFTEVMTLVEDALDYNPHALGITGPVDLRWQWCDQADRTVIAVRPHKPTTGRWDACPCENGHGAGREDR